MRNTLIIFGRLQDTRQEKKIMYKLLDIVVITIISVMCGCTDWEEVAEFGRARLAVLRTYLDLRNGVPSHDTFRRVMGMIDPKALEGCYWAWVQSILPEVAVDLISFDGKTVRGSGKPGLKPIHLISAWSFRAGITLAQLKTATKSNEITAIPELLDILNIEGCIVTIDAIGCQTEITRKVVKKGGAYVSGCKEWLFRPIRPATAWHSATWPHLIQPVNRMTFGRSTHPDRPQADTSNPIINALGELSRNKLLTVQPAGNP
jgi:predicted transposase YbfD/YdcC